MSFLKGVLIVNFVVVFIIRVRFLDGLLSNRILICVCVPSRLCPCGDVVVCLCVCVTVDVAAIFECRSTGWSGRASPSVARPPRFSFVLTGLAI